jgi:hypothetical protein
MKQLVEKARRREEGGGRREEGFHPRLPDRLHGTNTNFSFSPPCSHFFLLALPHPLLSPSQIFLGIVKGNPSMLPQQLEGEGLLVDVMLGLKQYSKAEMMCHKCIEEHIKLSGGCCVAVVECQLQLSNISEVRPGRKGRSRWKG